MSANRREISDRTSNVVRHGKLIKLPVPVSSGLMVVIDCGVSNDAVSVRSLAIDVSVGVSESVSSLDQKNVTMSSTLEKTSVDRLSVKNGATRLNRSIAIFRSASLVFMEDKGEINSFLVTYAYARHVASILYSKVTFDRDGMEL